MTNKLILGVYSNLSASKLTYVIVENYIFICALETIPRGLQHLSKLGVTIKVELIQKVALLETA